MITFNDPIWHATLHPHPWGALSHTDSKRGLWDLLWPQDSNQLGIPCTSPLLSFSIYSWTSLLGTGRKAETAAQLSQPRP